jgi:hypothetical protein
MWQKSTTDDLASAHPLEPAQSDVDSEMLSYKSGQICSMRINAAALLLAQPWSAEHKLFEASLAAICTLHGTHRMCRNRKFISTTNASRWVWPASSICVPLLNIK